MKQIYFLLIALCFITTTKAQIVNIPDANIKDVLLNANVNNKTAKNLSGNYFKIDANSDGEIQFTEAQQVSFLSAAAQTTYITSLEGINSFVNLTELVCGGNIPTLDLTGLTKLQKLTCWYSNMNSLNISGLSNLVELNCSANNLTNLNLDGLTSLKKFDCSANLITSLNLSLLTNLTSLSCNGNSITNLNVSNNTNLDYLACGGNQLSTLDVSKLSHLTSLDCGNNKITSLDLSKLPNLKSLMFNYSDIVSIFLKNGTSLNYFQYYNSSKLEYICADETEIPYIQSVLKSLNYSKCAINSYCSFVPGGEFYTASGTIKFDLNNDGCDSFDPVFPNLKFSISNGIASTQLIINKSGNYSISIQAGTHTITPVVENKSYFNISPASIIINFPDAISPHIQNFCITPNGSHPDLEVALLPLEPARPGFDTKYKIVYKNKGNIAQSGSINLNFKDSVLDLVAANPVTTKQTTNNLSWDFINLIPLETREITFTLKVNFPMQNPPVNGGDVLAYNSTITSAATDETPADNTFAFNQIVVNSFDPNDKTCLEGTTISPSLIGQYVHYMIRFENNGTANAKNIVVKDMIDLSKFDISTLVPTSASHSFVTNISAGNKVEFIFENINLPFDDANNDGYIAFKIKTLPTLKVGDTFTNDASIYFDYNFPVVTKPASSTFKTLGTTDFEFSNYFTLYQNPAKSVLNISSKETIEVKSISIYNALGQLVLVVPNAEKVSKIDVSSLTAGNYFIKINSDKGTSNARFIKE